MDASAKKIFWVQSIKAALFSLVFACIGVLLLGLLAKLFTLPENVLPIVNQALKGVAAAIGVALCVKEEKYLCKALIAAVVYWALSSLLFGFLGGWHFGQIALDLAVAVVPAVVVALIKIKRGR